MAEQILVNVINNTIIRTDIKEPTDSPNQQIIRPPEIFFFWSTDTQPLIWKDFISRLALYCFNLTYKTSPNLNEDFTTLFLRTYAQHFANPELYNITPQQLSEKGKIGETNPFTMLILRHCIISWKPRPEPNNALIFKTRPDRFATRLILKIHKPTVCTYLHIEMLLIKD